MPPCMGGIFLPILGYFTLVRVFVILQRRKTQKFNDFEL